MDEVARSARRLIASLLTSAELRLREVLAAKAKVRSQARFGGQGNQDAEHAFQARRSVTLEKLKR